MVEEGTVIVVEVVVAVVDEEFVAFFFFTFFLIAFFRLAILTILLHGLDKDVEGTVIVVEVVAVIGEESVIFFRDLKYIDSRTANRMVSNAEAQPFQFISMNKES